MRKRENDLKRLNEYVERFEKLSTEELRQRLTFGGSSLIKDARVALRRILEEREEKFDETTPQTLRHIAFLVAYDGSEFCGSQRQTNGPSVQASLERALEKVFKVETPVVLAGRTDAGVHATGQVAKFSTENESLPTLRVPLALNTLLEKSVRVRDAREVESDFHPRFSAKGRIYRYRIEQAKTSNPMLRTIAASIRDELNLEAMRDASRPLLGRQDFKAWQSAGSPSPTTIREVRRIEITETEAFGSRLIEIEIEADAFLYQMVRNIVGALIEAGRGRLSSEDVRKLTAGLDRTKCPAPAPPPGLCLTQVNY